MRNQANCNIKVLSEKIYKKVKCKEQPYWCPFKNFKIRKKITYLWIYQKKRKCMYLVESQSFGELRVKHPCPSLLVILLSHLKQVVLTLSASSKQKKLNYLKKKCTDRTMYLGEKNLFAILWLISLIYATGKLLYQKEVRLTKKNFAL